MQARNLRLLEATPEPPDGDRGEGGAVRAPRMNLIEIGLYLYRSVHVLGDDEARQMREAAHRAGASAALVAAALRLRDQRKAADVQVIA